MYHSVGNGAPSSVSVDRFQMDLEWLAANFDIIGLEKIFDLSKNDQQTQGVALTFDDGIRNFYTEVLPLLREWNAPATVFPISSMVVPESGGKADPLFEGYKPMTESMMEELATEDLITIGSHSKTHVRLPSIDDQKRQEDEIIGSKIELQERYGINVSIFSYPYGEFDRKSQSLVESTYKFAVTTRPGIIFSTRALNPCKLPRIQGHLPQSRLKFELTNFSGRLRQVLDPMKNLVKQVKADDFFNKTLL